MRAEFRPQRLGVAHVPQILADRRGAPGRVVVGKFVMRAAGASAAAAASAAIMPESMALWLPLMRGTFMKPASQPISAPPGNASFGTDW